MCSRGLSAVSTQPAPAGEWNGGEVVIRNEWQDWRRFRLRRKCKSCGKCCTTMNKVRIKSRILSDCLFMAKCSLLHLGCCWFLCRKQKDGNDRKMSSWNIFQGFYCWEELKKKRWREQVKTEDHFSSQIDKLFLSLLVWVRHPLLLPEALPLCGVFWAETKRRKRNSTVRMKDGLGNFNWVDLKGLGATQ